MIRGLTSRGQRRGFAVLLVTVFIRFCRDVMLLTQPSGKNDVDDDVVSSASPAALTHSGSLWVFVGFCGYI